MLTSVGLLALLPYVLKRGWRQRSGDLGVDSGYASVMAAVDAFEGPAKGAEAPRDFGEEDIEELMAHLFALRMTVSDVTAEVEETRDLLEGEPDGDEDKPEDGATDTEEPEAAAPSLKDAA